MNKLTPEQRDWIIEIVRKNWSNADSSYFLDIIKNEINANTAEDEDDDCYCTDENECHYCLENKSDARWLQEQERQITLRMIEEFIAEFPANKNLTVGFYVNLMKERLQQEDE